MSNKSHDRRTILAGIGSVTGSVALAGCSGSGPLDQVLGDDGPGGVLLWHQLATEPAGNSDGPSQSTTLERQLQRYRDANDGTSVTAERIGSNYQTRLAAGLPNDNGPHAFSWVHRTLGTYQGRGLLYETPTDEESARLDLDVEETFLPVALEASEFRPFLDTGSDRGDKPQRGSEPRRYGLPYGAATVTLAYNPEYVDSDSPPETVSEWFDSMDECENSEDGCEHGLVCPGAPFYVSPWARAFGGEYYDDEAGEFRFDSDDTVEGLSYFIDEVWSYTPDKPGYDEQYKRFKNGDAAYAIATPGEFARLDEKDAVEEVRATTLPTFENEDATLSPYVDVYLWQFSRLLRKRAERRAAALDVLQWLTMTDSVVATNATEHGFIPVIESPPDAVTEDETMSTYVESVRAGAPSPSHPDMQDGWTRLQEALENVLNSDAELREALSDARDDLESDD